MDMDNTNANSNLYLIPTGTKLHAYNPYIDILMLTTNWKPSPNIGNFEKFILSYLEVPEHEYSAKWEFICNPQKHNLDISESDKKLLLKLKSFPDGCQQSELKEAVRDLPKRSINVKVDEKSYTGDYLSADGIAFSYSPQERALMLYDAITAKDTNGNYIYNNIYITGGSNTEDVILELEKILSEKKETLPNRNQDLTIFGFSDATQLLHYLGQRGTATPYYYSKSPLNLVEEIENGAFGNDLEKTFELTAFNETASRLKLKQPLAGHTLPGNQVQVENQPTHQTQFFNEGYNFIIAEFRSKENVDSFMELYQKKFTDKNVVLLLSKDTPSEALKRLKEINPDIPVFHGMPVGHGDCQHTGHGIPLYSESSLTVNSDGNLTLTCASKSPDNVTKLLNQEKRLVDKLNGGNETEAKVKRINGNDGVVFENLTSLKSGASEYTISLIAEQNKNGSYTHPWQQIDMAVKELLKREIIDTEKLTTLKFKVPHLQPEHMETIQKGLNGLIDSRLQNSEGKKPAISLNGIALNTANNDMCAHQNSTTNTQVTKSTANKATQTIITGMLAISAIFNNTPNQTGISNKTDSTAFTANGEHAATSNQNKHSAKRSSLSFSMLKSAFSGGARK